MKLIKKIATIVMIATTMVAPIATTSAVMAADKLPTKGVNAVITDTKGNTTYHYVDGTMEKTGSGSYTPTERVSGSSITDAEGKDITWVKNLSTKTYTISTGILGFKTEKVQVTKRGNYYSFGTNNATYTVNKNTGKISKAKYTGARTQLWTIYSYKNGEMFIINNETGKLLTSEIFQSPFYKTEYNKLNDVIKAKTLIAKLLARTGVKYQRFTFR